MFRSHCEDPAVKFTAGDEAISSIVCQETEWDCRAPQIDKKAARNDKLK